MEESGCCYLNPLKVRWPHIRCLQKWYNKKYTVPPMSYCSLRVELELKQTNQCFRNTQGIEEQVKWYHKNVAIETRLKRSPVQVSSARQWHGNNRGVVQVRRTSETEHPNVTLCLDHLNKPTIKYFSRQLEKFEYNLGIKCYQRIVKFVRYDNVPVVI